MLTKNSIIIENLLSNCFFVDIMDDCGENNGGFYCRIYDKSRIIYQEDNWVIPKDYGDYFDDFCIHIGDCKFDDANIINFILNYIKRNIKEEDLA